MAEAYVLKRRYIEEQVVPFHRLGRHVNHDSRSLSYQVVPLASAVLKSVKYARVAPIFDQGELGSCTGNAAVGAIGTDPYYLTLPGGHPLLDEPEAIEIYAEATRIDGYAGDYPPDDTGSDGLSVAKVLLADGLISGYQHATSLQAVQTALQSGPIITGVNWYDSFDNPASDGTVAISKNAQVRGGHEFEVLGIDLDKKLFLAANSWSDSWGIGGYFQFSFDTYSRLLSEDGDATLFTPLNQPAPTPTPPEPTPTPTPTPTPVVDPADIAFARKAHAFLGGKHWFYRTFQGDVKAWLSARDL